MCVSECVCVSACVCIFVCVKERERELGGGRLERVGRGGEVGGRK